MTLTYRYLLVLTCILLLIIGGCRGFTGGPGKIKSYNYPLSNKKIVSIVDQFLLDHPDYYNRPLHEFEEVHSWVSERIYIKTPPGNDHFKFRIGGDSEISLISAGKENQTPKIERKLWFFEKDRLTKSFENNFLKKLEAYQPKNIQLTLTPFILAVNTKNSKAWPLYYIEQDTLISYPLPIEFDSLSIDYFKDLVTVYNHQTNNDLPIIQHHNIFRIGTKYSGHIDDSIYITKLYRLIGEPQIFNPIFDETNWQKFLLDLNQQNRLDTYKNLRQQRTDNNYKETDVYSPYSKEMWMKNNKWLKTQN